MKLDKPGIVALVVGGAGVTARHSWICAPAPELLALCPGPLDFPQKFCLKNLVVPFAVTFKAWAAKLSFLCCENCQSW